MSSLDPFLNKPPSNTTPEVSPERFWRSFADLEDSPEFIAKLADEFPEQAEELADPLSRRRFFQLMGASMALAGVANSGCRWEEDHVVPLSRRPENYVPGTSKMFATSMEIGGVSSALLAKSFDGRPIKVEGNPEHPVSAGKSSAFEQASLLHLYDPDRSRAPSYRAPGEKKINGSNFEDFDKMWKATVDGLRQSGGDGLAILSEATDSPTIARLRAKMATNNLSDAKWYSWEPLNSDNERVGLTAALGTPLKSIYNLNVANVVLSLDCDFLGDHPEKLRYAREFAGRRDPDAPKTQMNRLYSVESTFSLTGGAADHRLPLRSGAIKQFLLAVEAAIGKGRGKALEGAGALMADREIAKFASALVDDLLGAARRGGALICVGARQPAEVHAIAARVNARLKATDRAAKYIPVGAPGAQGQVDGSGNELPLAEQIRRLTADMTSGKVKTLVILGGNPAYDAPAELGFASVLSKHPHSVHLSLYKNETSVNANWHVPRTHYLEEWGDGRSWDGTHTLRQPLIRPLFGGRSSLNLVSWFSGDQLKQPRDVVRETVAAKDAAGEIAWRRAVQAGFVAKSETKALASATLQSFRTTPLSGIEAEGKKTTNGSLEVVFAASGTAYDGRFANNAWLQETPDFMTKITWGNAALISIDTAADLGVKNEQNIKVAVDGREVEIPAYIMPGQASSSITIPLGYGREHAGVVAGYVGKVSSVGVNAYPLRMSTELGFASNASVSKGSGSQKLATTQEHWAMDSLGRETVQERIPLLVKEATLSEYRSHPGFVKDSGHTEDWKRLNQPKTNNDDETGESFKHNLFTTKHQYPDHKWGMTIDLSKCSGCNSCMVACQSENNVPVVGKEQVMKNREMHWIRIDRYFAGDPTNPRIAHQPVHCQQCENAPCEQVCPVGATLHSEEGLNDMVYNRCVGTRYCANNCPYKVRRFNFHHWNKSFDDARNKVRELLFNPEVTVRSRGVMEKCTWCVQRIADTTIKIRNEQVQGDSERRLVDGEIQSACQQACPSDAIVFGDLNDKTSRVSKLQNSERAYLLLADLNNRPRNAFLARIRNPNPVLEPVAKPKAH